MPFAKILWYYLWIGPHLLLAVLAGVMLWRKLARAFPWFFVYLCFEIAEFAFLFVLDRLGIPGQRYYRVSSSAAIVDTILHFGIILEILRQIVSNYVVLAEVLKPLFRWATICLVIAALAFAVYAGGGRYADRSWFVTNMLERTVLIVQTGLLGGLLLFSRYLTLSWRDTVFGIALGLGLYASVNLITTAISSYAGFWHAELLDYVNMTAYHASVLVWLGYLLMPKCNSPKGGQAVPVHDELEVWNDELERLLHR